MSVSEVEIGTESVESMLAQIKVAPSKGPSGFTSQELADAKGWSRKRSLDWIKARMGEGRVKFAGYRQVPRPTDGQLGNVPVYTSVKGKR